LFVAFVLIRIYQIARTPTGETKLRSMRWVKYKQKISLDKLLLYELLEFEFKNVQVLFVSTMFLSTLFHIEKATPLSGLFLTIEGKLRKHYDLVTLLS
jgi:hypothetical protein